ncbi:MAG: putative toxin-antitoxin system toxin component, PIN family [Magnetococcales bacterium]|nr:putative toxin-antitoxin system toxin component, PIN family [Magnetococcales bacterium]
MIVVLDTSVFVASLLSPDGINREVLRRCLRKQLQPLMGAALLAEYEDLLNRNAIFANSPISSRERWDLFESLLSVSKWTTIFFGWRPNLRDESDNHLVELAVAGNASVIVTNNIKDFIGSELHFQKLDILTPLQLIERIS